jgi:hypothetical protein
MGKIISAQTAGNILLVLFGLLVAFHILILFNLLPTNIVWGGRAALSSSRYIDVNRLSSVIDIFLWIIFAYLLLNAAGNLASSSSLEKLLFTPITIVAALLVLRLVIGR